MKEHKKYPQEPYLIDESWADGCVQRQLFVWKTNLKITFNYPTGWGDVQAQKV